MAIILAVKPKWAEKAYSGEKTLELRKMSFGHVFADTSAVKAYIYETAPVRAVTGSVVLSKLMLCEMVGLGEDEMRARACLTEGEIISYLGTAKMRAGCPCMMYDVRRYPRPVKALDMGRLGVPKPQVYARLSA